MINVTQTFLPPIEEYQAILQRAWDAKWLTNRGQLVKELEEKLKDYLEVKNLTLTTNGTLPIQIAIKAMDLQGEIITTPFSYVATTASIVWENCKPIFVDIHPDYLTIDESKIEAAITDKTSAILATHVFGNPCHVEAIEAIAQKHNLKVIYDAAHCFGVTYNGKSIFEFGDVSTCSFHATKIFHTGEGGCWITNNSELHQKIYYHHNFGHKNQEEFLGLGTNAKMSELQAALGLAVFKYIEEIIVGRKVVVNLYDYFFKDTFIQRLKIRENTNWNFHYYPVVFETEEKLLNAKELMNAQQIFPRRYFYPSLNKLPYLDYKHCEISESISKRILCLPLYVGLEKGKVEQITKIVSNA